jgi:hypothetical protein
MPINFHCPHCHKPLKVKDEQAGKKGPCPACKKILTIPRATAAPPPPAPPATTNGPPPPAPAAAVDVEAAAAALFADAPAKAEAAPQFIDFPCPYCDEPLHLDAALAGKKHPCPSCKRIISVPLPKVEKKDWRTLDTRLPSGAQRPAEPAPEGAWSSTATSRVSNQALDEAGLLPQKRVPRTLGQKVRRGLLAAGAVAAVAALAFAGWKWWAAGRQERALKQALDYANTEAAAKHVGKEGQAALHVGAGTYFLRTRKAQCGKRAAEQFGQAFGLLSAPVAGDHEWEREAALTELALALVELGGGPEDLERELRLKWDDVQKRVQVALAAIVMPEARLEALRGVAGRLVAHGQAARVLPLVRSVYSAAGADQAEALAVVGLELLGLAQEALAAEAAEQALAVYGPDSQPRPRLRAPVVALALALKRAAPKAEKNIEDQTQELIGQAEGLARLGQWDQAQAKLRATNDYGPEVRTRARVAFAAGVAAGQAEDKSRLGPAVEVAAQDRPSRPELSWVLLRLTRLAARSDLPEERQYFVAGGVAVPAVRGHAQLAVLRARLAAAPKVVGDDADGKVLGKGLAHQLGRLALARHNARRDAGWAKVVEGWEGPERAFGSLGVALGLQGKD